MRAVDGIEAAPDVVGLLPRHVLRWVKSAVVVAFFVLLIVGKAEDVVIWMVRELTAVATDRMQPMLDAARIAANLRPGVVLRTRAFQAKPVRKHAKFLCVDHRFLAVTSANFSWSAEYGNVELGVMLDNPNVAESVEREMRGAEHSIYEVVDP